MGFFKDLWEDFKTDENRLSIGISFSSMVISLVVALVVIAGFVWGIWWSRAQEKKAGDRATAQATKDDARTKSFENQVNRLQDIHKASIEKLGKEYAKIVSGEISDLETEMSSFVERSDEMVLDEKDRKTLASHASDKNVEQAREDAYKKALDEGVEGYYIFEINQAAGRFGHGVFMTDSTWCRGDPVKGSSSLLTEEEKEYIDPLLDSYFKEEKSGKRKDGFADPNTQKEIFFFLLAESGIGRITEPPKRQISYWASYREQKIEVLSPYAKLGAVIGHIGDKMRSYE